MSLRFTVSFLQQFSYPRLRLARGLLVSRILKHQSSVLKNVVTPLRTMSFLLSVPLVTGSDVSLAALCAGTLGFVVVHLLRISSDFFLG